MNKSVSREDRTFPAYLFGGRLRTSTLALIVAFAAIWWLYETYEPAAESPPQVPASEVVPPGFVPDPAYTWAPRTDFQRQTPTSTTAPTTTPSTTEPSTPTTTPGEEPPTSGEPTSPAVTPSSPVAGPVTGPVAPSPAPPGPPPGPAPGPPPPAPPPGG